VPLALAPKSKSLARYRKTLSRAMRYDYRSRQEPVNAYLIVGVAGEWVGGLILIGVTRLTRLN
jgi:hypothetical protein